MNQKSDDLRLHVAETLPANVSNLDPIFSFLRSVDADSDTALELSQSFEILELQIGDELRNYLQKQSGIEYYYIICQGRVRLLSFDPKQQREVSVQVLQAEETFGAEHLFSHPPRLTRAIAASAVQLARISLTQLQQWYDRIPNLEAHLRQQARQRNCLTFFKTMTELRSLASLQLQQLVPYLQEKHIASGTVLLEATPAGTGRFWLSSGTVQSQSSQSPPPTAGQSWENSDPTADWVAATDLVAYQLAKEHWANASAIAPVLFGGQVNGAKQKLVRNGHHRSQATKIPLSQKQPVKQEQHSDIQPERPRAAAKKSAAIAFPKPQELWRRSLRRWQHPFIQQQSTADCGATCLAMVGRYWGKSFGLNYLRDLAGVGRTGASLKGLAKAAESLGFHARPVRASLSRLVDRTNPWIAHWQGDHYVVVYRTKGDRLLVADPAVGKRSLSYEEFQASWTGYALLLDPTERLQDAEGNHGISLKQFWSAFLPYRSILGQIIVASLLLQVFGLVTPLFTQLVLDRVVVEKSFSTLNVFVVGLLLFGVWRIGLVAVRQYLLDYFSNRMDLTFISGFISHTLRLPLKFFELRQVGDILTRVQENQKIQLFLTRQAIGAWLDALTAIVYVGLMFYYNSSLTLLVLSLIVPIIILTVAASPFLRQVSRQIFKESAAQNSTLVEMMSGVATIKATAAERELRWLWEERFTSMLNARFRGQKLANGLQVLSSLVNSVGSTALLWYGAVLVMQDQLTIGQFVAFNMLIGNVINPILSLVGLWDEFQEVLVSLERLNDVFSTEPEEDLQKPLLVLPQLRGEVKFENVSFRYGEDEERNILENISLEARAGQTIAIVGRSGSGKTTLVKLLQGLYHPQNGRVWIDGHDIQHVSPTSLRSQLGVVPQECFLFSGTILENITLYRSEISLEQAIEVAKLAEAHGFIQALPLGYNTKVGERGANLSGGQRQRIAIARALLGNPRILILDEATSSLDTESERRFQQNLTRISRDRTTFIIAHRLSTVRNADLILVLERGILAEQGTHEQLMAKQGIYYYLAQQQLQL